MKKLKSKVKNITLEIIDCLLKFTETFLVASISKKDAWKIINGNYNFEWTRTKFAKQISSMEHRGYLNIVDSNGQKSIEFTNKAKIKVLDKLAERKKADNKLRFVSFDIPEDKRQNRNLFRKSLKKLGFKQIQKSLWVVNCNVGDLVELAAYEFQVEKYIVYLVSEKTDIDGLISKMFKHTDQ
jgi:DNA-binding transcriptional regulator PaaX